MRPFVAAHASHPDALMALALAVAQLEAQLDGQRPRRRPTLGFVYFTDHYAAQAEALYADLQQRFALTQWVGAVGVGVAANGAEYFDEPGLVLMVCGLAASQFTVFNGRQPLNAGAAHSALVHAEPNTPDLGELIQEMAQRTHSGYLFGGLASSRSRHWHVANGLFEGGLSGVAFGPKVALVSRVTQGCLPLGPPRRITRSERNLVLQLDHHDALPLLLGDLGVSLDDPPRAVAALRTTLAGLTDEHDAALGRGGQFGADTRVRHLVGVDPTRQAVALGDWVQSGQQLAFCRRDVEAARRDLMRICAELRDEVESHASAKQRMLGALYVSCNGRGGAHFGGPSAELKIIQHALGDVPLAGFFAGGEIAHHHLYGYTGVLTVFVG